MCELRPEDIVERLRHTIRYGKPGKDYTVVPREKNKKFREEYLIDDKKVDEILLSLSESDYFGSEESVNEKHGEDTVHIFEKTVSLIPRYYEKIERKNVRLYIKFTWSEYENKMLIIISLHESDI